MEVSVINIHDVGSALYRKLRSLNLRDLGSMQETLSACRANKQCRTSQAYVVQQDNVVLGWALTYKQRENLQRTNNKTCAQFYVRRAARRRGIGRKLVAAVRARDVDKVHVTQWDYRSRRFFDATEFPQEVRI